MHRPDSSVVTAYSVCMVTTRSWVRIPLGQLSIWNRRTLAQNEYYMYRQIPLHTHVNSQIKSETLVW